MQSNSLIKVVAILLFAGFLPLACHAASDVQKKFAFDAVERNADAIALVGDSLYYFAELGMQEFESAKFLEATFESIGFKVETGGAGMPTNVWSQWGSGMFKVVAVTEID